VGLSLRRHAASEVDQQVRGLRQRIRDAQSAAPNLGASHRHAVPDYRDDHCAVTDLPVPSPGTRQRASALPKMSTPGLRVVAVTDTSSERATLVIPRSGRVISHRDRASVRRFAYPAIEVAT